MTVVRSFLVLLLTLFSTQVFAAESKIEDQVKAVEDQSKLSEEGKSENSLKDIRVNKVPKSLFLIKRKIEESEFGEPEIYTFERHQRVINNDPRLQDPHSNSR
ncbi:MAG: hypothetical protein KDD25_00545 [Bdellovibrionales bacterium]|nr:hypothetical protein [Bdellovibrionales bacterium]